MKGVYLKFILLVSVICLGASLLVFNYYGRKESIAPQEVKEYNFMLQKQRAIENQTRFFSPQSPWIKETYTVKLGESLYRISRLFGITVQLLKQVNRLNSDIIQPGMKLEIPAPKFRIDINLSRRLLLLSSNDELVAAYSIGIGENSSTPHGEFTIVNKVINPVWYRIGAVIPAGSPENVLGSRWLGLSIEGYGLHGTTEPESIGQATSLGCIRMQNKDVKQLFDWVTTGTPVRIFDESD